MRLALTPARLQSFALGCGSVIEIDFPSAFCPRYTVVRLGESVLLETEHGRETSMSLIVLRDRLRRGECRVVTN
jgi:hypothetical protein